MKEFTFRGTLPSSVLIILIILLGTGWLNCDNEGDPNNDPDGDIGQDSDTDSDLDADLDTESDESQDADENASSGNVHDCRGSGEGVTITGTVEFSGDIPDPAMFYVYLSPIPPTGPPPCIMTVGQVDSFPVDFELDNVSSEYNGVWGLHGFLDVDGAGIPMPADGDFMAAIPPEELDLTADVVDVVLTLEEYHP